MWDRDSWRGSAAGRFLSAWRRSFVQFVPRSVVITFLAFIGIETASVIAPHP